MAALGYRAASEAASTEPRTGVIILFKPVLTGKEDADLLQYGREDGQGFPHQATTDQWYDEAQFESYRRLGQLTAHALMESLEEEDRQKDGQVKEINQRLKAGSPIPAAEAPLLFNVARRIAERESQLKKKEIITVKDPDEEAHSGE
jgi:hypothetical protein